MTARQQSLVDKLEEPVNNEPPKKKRRLSRRTTEEATDRCIQEHCGHMTSKQLDSDLVQGQTFRQRLLSLKRGAKSRKGKVSTKQLTSLAKRYGAGEVAGGGLHVADATMPVDPNLETACGLALHKNLSLKSRSPLIACLRTLAVINQREVVGVLRCLCQLNVVANIQVRRDVVQIIQELTRLDVHVHCAAELAQLHNMFDQALSLHYGSHRARGGSTRSWWETYGFCIHALGGTHFQDMGDIMAEVNDTSRVQAQLLRVRQTAVGKKIFAAIGDLMTLSKASADLAKEIEKVKDIDVDPDKFAALQDPKLSSLQSLPWPELSFTLKLIWPLVGPLYDLGFLFFFKTNKKKV